jgi:serine/threonine protein kinase
VVKAASIDYPETMRAAVPDTRARRLGRYSLHDKIGAGGMATVHLGRLVGEGGFSRVVAIKCMASHLAEDPEFRAMFLDEARLAARVRHPNVVSTIDVGTSDDDGMFLVMEYVPGESLAALARKTGERGVRLPIGIAVRILVDTLSGLHAAHTATDELGAPLAIVHRDVSPQNILVATDGLARVLDFGIAKAAGRSYATRNGEVKGKFRYMAPEQVKDRPVNAQSDVYSASVVLWEMLTGERLFAGSNDAAIVARVLEGVVPPPSKLAPDVPNELDWIVRRGLQRDPAERFASALEMAEALETIGHPATARQVGRWVEETAGDVIERRREQIARMNGAGGAAEHPQIAGLTPGGLVLPGPKGIAPEPNTQTSTSTLEANAVDALLPSVESPAGVGRDAGGSSGRLRRFALAGSLGIGLATVAFVVTSARMRASSAIQLESKTEPAASAWPAVEAPAAPASGETTALALPSMDPAAAASVAPTPSAPPGTPRGGASHGQGRGHTKPGAAKPSCNPPYFQDPSGIRRVKPECL